MTEYTDEERTTLRDAAFGAMMLVSQADPGFLAMFKESVAGAKALAGAPADLQQLFKGGGMPSMPRGSAADVESTTLGKLRQAAAILRAKAPQDLQSYQAVIAAACDQVAAASEGVKETESAMISKVKAAVGIA
jgi:hypothetical protein